MLEELKKMNKQYYDEYEENDCNIDDRDGESRIPVNGEIHKETKIQQLMFKIIIFVAVFSDTTNIPLIFSSLSIINFFAFSTSSSFINKDIPQLLLMVLGVGITIFSKCSLLKHFSAIMAKFVVSKLITVIIIY